MKFDYRSRALTEAFLIVGTNFLETIFVSGSVLFVRSGEHHLKADWGH